MRKITIFAVALAALAVCAGARAETEAAPNEQPAEAASEAQTKRSTRNASQMSDEECLEEIRKAIRERRKQLHPEWEGVEEKVDVTTNADGTVTYAGPVHFESNTNITRIAVTFKHGGTLRKRRLEREAQHQQQTKP